MASATETPSVRAVRAPSGVMAWLAARPLAWEGVAIGLLLALAAALPVLVAAYPQMADYPAHLARYHVMIDGGRSPFLARYYDFNWILTGNLGVDLLIQPMAALFGLEPAGRIIAGLIPVLTGLGIIAVEWSLRRRVGIGAMLAFAFIWSPALLMGFLNFALAMALALLAFALWVRLEGWRWRPALFLPIGCLVWLCHVSGWGVLGLMVFGYEWHRRRNFSAFIAPWPLTLPFLALLSGGGAHGALTYGRNVLTYKGVIWESAMRDSWAALDYASLGLVGLGIVITLALGRIDGRLGWTGFLMLLLSLIMPRHIFGGDYADYRMITSGLLVACLAISWQAPRWLLWLAPALFLVRLGVTTDEWNRTSQQTERMLAVLDHLPQGARVASATEDDLLQWGNDAFAHVCAYAVVRRDALVNCNFALKGVHALTLREGGDGFVDPSQRVFRYPGRPIDLSAFPPAAHADYLWYVGGTMPERLPPDSQVQFRTQGSLLLRLAKPRNRG